MENSTIDKGIIRSKIYSSLIYLVATLISISSYFLRDAIINLQNNNYLAWLLTWVFMIILLIVQATIFAYAKKLQWDKNVYIKCGLIIFNIAILTILICMILPFLFPEQNWLWVFLFPISFTLIRIMDTLFIKRLWIGLIIRGILIVALGIIPVIVGNIYKENIVIAGGSWILIWEVKDILWDTFFIKHAIKQERYLPYYPWISNSLYIYLIHIFVWYLIPTNIPDPFDIDHDK